MFFSYWGEELDFCQEGFEVDLFVVSISDVAQKSSPVASTKEVIAGPIPSASIQQQKKQYVSGCFASQLICQVETTPLGTSCRPFTS